MKQKTLRQAKYQIYKTAIKWNVGKYKNWMLFLKWKILDST